MEEEGHQRRQEREDSEGVEVGGGKDKKERGERRKGGRREKRLESFTQEVWERRKEQGGREGKVKEGTKDLKPRKRYKFKWI